MNLEKFLRTRFFEEHVWATASKIDTFMRDKLSKLLKQILQKIIAPSIA